MTLVEVARIALPPHPPDGGFDHAAVDSRAGRLYVAHTSNNAVDVVDLAARRYLSSIPTMSGVAGVWVAEADRRLFTSNRGEDTATVFDLDTSRELFRCPTGARPNGLAFDPGRGVLLVAGVGNATAPDAPPTLSFVDAAHGTSLGRLRMPGRTRWAIFHDPSKSFYVNIADPPAIAVIPSNDLPRIARMIPIPAKGPHGMEQDPSGRRLFCACDEGVLIGVEPRTGETTRIGTLAGAPDVLWLDSGRDRLYCAVEEPGVVHVFNTTSGQLLETVSTAMGAGTLTLDPVRHEVHVFLPGSHEDLVLRDE